MGWGLGDAFAAFTGNAAEAGADIMKTQRLYDMDQAAKAAELERKEHFAKFNWNLEAPQRNIENSYKDRQIQATEKNADTNKLNVESEISTRKANQERQSRQDKLQAERYKVNDSQLTNEYGKDEQGNIKQLSRGDVASGKYQVLDTKEKAMYLNSIKEEVTDAATEKHISTRAKKMIESGMDQREVEFGVQEAKRLGIDDPLKAINLYKSTPGLTPQQASEAKKLAEMARENDEYVTYAKNGKRYKKKAGSIPTDELIKIMAHKTMSNGSRPLPYQVEERNKQLSEQKQKQAIPVGIQEEEKRVGQGGSIGDMFAPLNPNNWPTFGQ